MRIKITRPDGTVIEAKGTAEECRQLVEPQPQPSVHIPSIYSPAWWGVEPYRVTDQITFTTDTITVTNAQGAS